MDLELFKTIGWILVKIVAIIVPVILGIVYLMYFERKVIGAMQARVGPNVVGPKGLLQPWADGIKLVFKEVLVPSSANKFLYIIAPIVTMATALAAWAVVPFDTGLVLSNINAGVLYILAVTSLGVYGVIIAGSEF
jgi:NADH-quinone oxidoreductase subunit H